MTRAERFDEAAEELCGNPPSDAEEVRADPDRYLLIEGNCRGSDPCHWFTGHATLEDAADYWTRQEYREDWDPIVLVDLDTGRRYDPIVGLRFDPIIPQPSAAAVVYGEGSFCPGLGT
jgi:hypothetical protein